MTDDFKPTIEILAFMELKANLVRVMCQFIDKYAAPESNCYPQCAGIMVDALESCLEEAKLQAGHSKKNLSNDEKAKNIVAFLSLLFGESRDCLDALFKMSPPYLVEKFDRYILSGCSESEWGLHTSLRRLVFEPYCDNWRLNYEENES